MHHVDRETPWDEIWQAMEVLVAQGKILYVGSSNFAGWHIAQAQAAAATRHFTGLVSEQSIYNLLTRDIEREVIPAAEHYGLGIIPWSPLHGGLLGGVLRKEREGGRRTSGRAADSLEEHRDQIERYEDLCEKLGQEPAEVGLAWLLTRPARHGADRRAADLGPARLGAGGARADARGLCRSMTSTTSSRATRRRPRTTPGKRCAEPPTAGAALGGSCVRALGL